MDTDRSTATLHLASVPSDKEAQLQMCFALFRKLTGREPTPEDMAQSRAVLGLPPEEPTERS